MENQMPTIERQRRFWSAHGDSRVHLTVLHALCNNPTVTWTPEGLRVWYGVETSEARQALGDFAECGIVERLPDGAFRLSDRLGWTIPRSRSVVESPWEATNG